MSLTTIKKIISESNNTTVSVSKLYLINNLFNDLSPVEKADILSELLNIPTIFPILRDKNINFIEMEENYSEDVLKCSDTITAWLLQMTKAPFISAETVEKIFTSSWAQKVIFYSSLEVYHWIFSYYNFKKDFLIRFLLAIEQNQSFSLWRLIPYADKNGKLTIHQIEIFTYVLKNIIKQWPTSGRSSITLLEKLRNIPSIQFILQQAEVAHLIDKAEEQCDFGSLDKIFSIT